MKAVSHNKLKRYEPAMKKQPADNKTSEARQVGGPCSITQSFSGSLTRLDLSSSVLTGMYILHALPRGAKNLFTLVFLDFSPSIVNEYSI